MKQSHLARIISALLSGALFGYYVHWDYLRWSQRGREAFLAYQSHRFDQSMAAPNPAFITIFVTTIVVAIALGIYELIVALVSRVMRASDGGTTPPAGMG